MKLPFVFIGLLFVLCYSCTSTTDEQTKEIDSLNNSTDSINIDNSSQAIWKMDFDSVLKKDTMIKLREVNSDTLTPQKLISILNNTWPDIHIDFIKTAHDTIFIKIPDSNVLTQQMGTSGSNSYVSTAIYTLTELKGIRYVNFDFIEGDHAVPGTYGRIW
ncbi:hypothetical protein LK994_13625 [Ferruginibacter lapsinanis]|uniref:hypothetical protein n=1 Tax=Ferruginibacter lapsinanis TaxID=563172 RepID=UPI001E52F40B|nr:hypothetical protein [Ferruginibacter lapsinanis]UEG49676.1 hypothetical protein LK994_13625 [Ferruginibacter lapsinanis]